MYLPGQIVYDLNKKVPFQMSGDVWALDQYPKRHTHFIRPSLKMTSQKNKEGLFYELYEIFLPASVKEAEKLLSLNLIIPAPCTPNHCWNCQAWLNGCKCGAERPANFYTVKALRDGGL